MTGIPVISEGADLASAAVSTSRGNYTDAAASLAGLGIPFLGGAAFKSLFKKVPKLLKRAEIFKPLSEKVGSPSIKSPKNHSLYRVVDASGNVEAAKFGSSIPASGTVGRRSGIQGTIQKNTDFDHISATTDQSWLTGKNNLFDRYGGDNPYVVKLQGHEGKIHQVAEESTDDILAKIRPGSYTNMKVAGPQNQEIVSILGSKGSKVSDVKGVMSKAEYDAAIKKDPNFKFKRGGYKQKYQKGGFEEFTSTNYTKDQLKNKNSNNAPWEVKKGVRAVESSNGINMINKTSSATGLYGQLFNEIKDLPELKNISREQFAADTTLQNKIFDMRWQGKLPDIPGLKNNAKMLQKKYPNQSKDYSLNELASISNFVGRKGSRKYFASIRDNTPFTVPGVNKTPEEYIEGYRTAVKKNKRGGYRPKYL